MSVEAAFIVRLMKHKISIHLLYQPFSVTFINCGHICRPTNLLWLTLVAERAKVCVYYRYGYS